MIKQSRVDGYADPSDPRPVDLPAGIYDFDFFSNSDSSKDRNYWGNLAEIALPRFPETQGREKIYLTEMRKRLKAIRKAGYDVQEDKGMGRQEVWNLLGRVKDDIYQKARKSCPAVVGRVLRANKARKLEAKING